MQPEHRGSRYAFCRIALKQLRSTTASTPNQKSDTQPTKHTGLYILITYHIIHFTFLIFNIAYLQDSWTSYIILISQRVRCVRFFQSMMDYKGTEHCFRCFKFLPCICHVASKVIYSLPSLL